MDRRHRRLNERNHCKVNGACGSENEINKMEISSHQQQPDAGERKKKCAREHTHILSRCRYKNKNVTLFDIVSFLIAKY